MSSVLYIAPTGNSDSVNGGYNFIANSTDVFFKRLLSKDIITHYDCIKSNFAGEFVDVTDYDIGIILTHPDSFQDVNYKQNIEMLKTHCKKFYLHIFWETTALPRSWNWIFEESLFDGFISSSKFVKKLIDTRIEEFNTEQNTFILSPVIYKYDYKDCAINLEEKLNEKIFTVLYMGQYTKRKGMEDAVTAYTHALGSKADCKLVLKYHSLSQYEYDPDEMIKRTITMNSRSFLSHIYDVKDNLNRTQIFDLYKHSSVLLFPTRGEGFGLPIMESAIVGLPIIYSNNSSCIEASGLNYQVKIPCHYDTATYMSHYNYDSESEYGIPSMKDMISNLKVLYSHWKKDKTLYYADGQQQFIFDKFSEENAIKQFAQLY
jgi:glycosyltransferase involved in cell wall biosynthesis